MKLIRAKKQDKKSRFTRFIGEGKTFQYKDADGNTKTGNGAQGIMVLTVVEDEEEIHIEDSLLTPMVIDGKTIDNMFWL